MMRRVLAAALALGMLAGAFGGMFLGDSGPGTTSHAEPPGGVRIWEAHAKGFAPITQVNVEYPPPGSGAHAAIGYLVGNALNRTVFIDEYVWLMSSHPVMGPIGGVETTQDGVLDLGTVPAGGSVTYIYGQLVLDGTFPNAPMWFCTEDSEVVQPNVDIRLGGEILPFAMETYVRNPWYNDDSDNAQIALWQYLRDHPTVIIGKTPLVKALTGAANETFRVTLSATNVSPWNSNSGLPRPDAPDVQVKDTVPANWTYRNPSHAPKNVTTNADGSTTITWTLSLPAVDITTHVPDSPPPYSNTLITYELVTPEGLAGGREYLPRARVDTDNDSVIDAHSAEPLLEIAQTNRPPSVTFASVSGVEGLPVTLTAIGGDPDGDALTFSFDFQDDGVFDQVGPDASATFTWWDDHLGTARVRVSDGTLSTEATAAVSVANVAPSVALIATSPEEGTALRLSYGISDPGSDDEEITVDWGDGTTESRMHQLGPSPDPPESHGADEHRSIADFLDHTYGDDGTIAGGVTVRDDDGGVRTVSISLAVMNGVPVAVATVAAGEEGEALAFAATATDPGSDDLEFFWDWNDGTSESRVFFNDGSGPDPDASYSGTYPFTATDAGTHTWGDDALFTVTLFVTDDDLGQTMLEIPVAVSNRAPDLTVDLSGTLLEGDPVIATAAFVDAGTDDVTLAWSWDFGPSGAAPFLHDPAFGPDPPMSPWGTHPVSGSQPTETVYGDNGDYSITVTACDDDGGCTSLTQGFTVANVAPTVDAGPDLHILEAGTATVSPSFSDPGFDSALAGTMEDFTATVAWELRSTQAPAVTEVPGSAGVLTTGALTASEAYGDNGVYVVTVTVCDDDGGCGSDTATFTVGNVAPTIEDLQIFAAADITLRVAGEKWHDVCLELSHNGAVTGAACVVRTPGSPDRQSATITGGRIQLLGDTAITLYYTPDDDPINGQRNGDNPAWVILTFADGSEVRLHHNFNVQHPGTWTWTIDDLRVHLAGRPLTFEVAGSDVGSDDLTFGLDFGDGGLFTETAFFDGASPDPARSPDLGGMTFATGTMHAYASAGTYLVTVSLRDDDGGGASTSVPITVG